MYRFSNGKSYIFVKESDGSYLGCEIKYRRGLENCGMILNFYYNSLEKAHKLVNKGKLYSIGVHDDCSFKGSENEFVKLLEMEAKYNLNYFNRFTIAYYDNLSESLEIVRLDSIEKIGALVNEGNTLFIYEDNTWFCFYRLIPNTKININKYFSDEEYYNSISKHMVATRSSWSYLQKKQEVYSSLYKIKKSCKYQLAAKVFYEDVILGNAIGYKNVSVNKIPFKIIRDKENYVDYYIAVNKDFEVYYVTKQWIKNNSEDIANAKIEGSRVIFSF